MLDDFFLYDTVDTSSVMKYLNIMKNDSTITAIYFSPLAAFTVQSQHEELEKLACEASCKVNLTLALWRKDALSGYLQADESAWEFEANALQRSFSRPTDNFYAVQTRTMKRIIPYDYGKFGLFAGMWFKATEELFLNNCIAQDFSKRGFYENYMFGTIPYVKRQIKMDSYVVSCYSLKRDNPKILALEIVNDGYFCQEYNMTDAESIIMWHPSTLHGFAIDDFKMTITSTASTIKTYSANDVYGSFSLYNESMYFLQWGAFVYASIGNSVAIKRVTVEGILNKDKPLDDLREASHLNPRIIPFSIVGVLNGARINAERLLILDNYRSFRTYASLQYKDGEGTSCTLYDGVERFVGEFVQEYDIDINVASSVTWEIGGSVGGFGVKDVEITCLCRNNNIRKLVNSEIKGGVHCLEYRVFLNAPGHMSFKLPHDQIVKIYIRGSMCAPLPKDVLRKILYGEYQGGLINRNGIGFILAMIRRGIKRYGLIGVITEVWMRLLRRTRT